MTPDEGVRLMNAATASYADVDELRIVGLVEADWPEPAERRIFYPWSILAQLGWPADAARSAADRARFRDLVALPRVRISASSFTLEDDAIVAPSAFVEELEGAGLPIERRQPYRVMPLLAHENLTSDCLEVQPTLEDAANGAVAAVARAPNVVSRRSLPRSHGSSRRQDLRSQPRRAVSRVSVQILRSAGAAPAGGAGRGTGSHAP